MFSKSVACAFGLNNDGMVQQAVEAVCERIAKL